MSFSDPNNKRKLKKDFPSDKQRDFFRAIHTFISGFVVERTNLTKKKHEKTLIDQFILKIKGIFPFGKTTEQEKKEEHKLFGRIHELSKNAGDVLKVLNTMREDLKKEVDDELYPFVEAVMNPMIRDISRIQKVVQKEGLMHQQIDAFNQYNEWIDRAKLWVQVCSTSKNKEAIEKAIIKHTFEDFIVIIERDLTLIRDYEEHLLDELEINDDEKNHLRNEIEKGLKSYLKSMNSLKNYPKSLKLEDLTNWKDQADKRRDRYFNTILQIIDNKTGEFNPFRKNKEEHDVLLGSFEQISYLETEIPLLAEKIDLSEDPFEIEVSMQQLLALQEEVDELYHDVRTPSSIIERLVDLKLILEHAFKKRH